MIGPSLAVCCAGAVTPMSHSLVPQHHRWHNRSNTIEYFLVRTKCSEENRRPKRTKEELRGSLKHVNRSLQADLLA